MPCRPVLDFHRFYSLTHAGGSTYSNSAPIHSRRFHTHTQSPRIPIPPYWPHVCRNRRGIAVGLHRRPPIHISRPSAIHKKLQSPQSHISQPIHCSPCLTDPHAPRISTSRPSPHTFSADPPYNPQAQKTRLQFRRDQRLAPQIQRRPSPANTTCLRLGVAPAPPVRTSSRPWSHFHGHAHGHGNIPSPGTPSTRPARTALADLHSNPTHSNSNVQRRGGHGVASRCDDVVDVRKGRRMPV